MMLIVTSPCRIDVFLARIVIPFSRSRSLVSMISVPTSWFSRKVWLCGSSASTSVVLPWSTWAMIATFRMSCRRLVTGLGNIRTRMRIWAGRAAVAAVAMALALAVSAMTASADEGWVIKSFKSTIQIQPDSTIAVSEDIVADFGGLQKHGIFRTIPIQSRSNNTEDRVYNIDVTSVTDGEQTLQFDAYVDN